MRCPKCGSQKVEIEIGVLVKLSTEGTLIIDSSNLAHQVEHAEYQPEDHAQCTQCGWDGQAEKLKEG